MLVDSVNREIVQVKRLIKHHVLPWANIIYSEIYFRDNTYLTNHEPNEITLSCDNTSYSHGSNAPNTETNF